MVSNTTIKRLASAIVNHQFTDSDRILTHILAHTRYPKAPYQLAMHLKGEVKKVLDSPRPIKTSKDAMWFLKTTTSKLATSLQEQKASQSAKH